MIAVLKNDQESQSAQSIQERFLEMLPLIRRHAIEAFRKFGSEAREELVQEVIANAFRTWRRLVDQRKDDVAYATPLAQYAIRQVRAGRRVGSRQHSLDILSRQAQRTYGFTVEPLHRQGTQREAWDELLVEDRKAGPAEIAAARLDLQQWLKQLSKRNRRIAQELALGDTTGEVAEKFKLSAGRISQLRRWLCEQWEQFHGDSQLVGSTV